MTRYTATIRHYSISRAPVVSVGDDLAAAKRNATREFGAGFVDHTIVIYDAQERDYGGGENIAASKRIGDRRWS